MTVKVAMVMGTGLLGPERQAALSQAEWVDIRTRINRSAPERPEAVCGACGWPVFVRAAASSLVRPHFHHFGGDRPPCEWAHDGNQDPELVRADIFQGRQESATHRALCETVLSLAQLDSRYVHHSGAVNLYVRPTDGSTRGRWPDVQFEIEGVGRFAIEVQLAPISAVDVARRGEFYAKDGRGLIWLLPACEYTLARKAVAADIGHAGSGTSFFLDEEAEVQGRRAGTLKLWAAWTTDGQVECRLVSLDELRWTSSGHPFFVDTVTPQIFRTAQERRRRHIDAICSRDDRNWDDPVRVVGEDYPLSLETVRLLGVLFTLWSVAQGEWINLHDMNPNPRGLLNSYLNSKDGRARASIIQQFVERTPVVSELNDTTHRKIREALETRQLDPSEPGVALALGLFPEVFRDDLRERASMMDELPDWAMSGGRWL